MRIELLMWSLGAHILVVIDTGGQNLECVSTMHGATYESSFVDILGDLDIIT
jgi:hypothetical protein